MATETPNSSDDPPMPTNETENEVPDSADPEPQVT